LKFVYPANVTFSVDWMSLSFGSTDFPSLEAAIERTVTLISAAAAVGVNPVSPTNTTPSRSSI
jgi:hypothetical protein